MPAILKSDGMFNINPVISLRLRLVTGLEHVCVIKRPTDILCILITFSYRTRLSHGFSIVQLA